jgi:anti-anti-sigma factor
MLKTNESSDVQWTISSLEHKQGIHSARLVGSLDEHTVSQLRELSDVAFDEEGFSIGDDFVIDLAEVTEIDHVGFAALVGILVGISAKAGSLALILPPEHPVRHALQVTGLDRAFDVFETHTAACEQVDALSM